MLKYFFIFLFFLGFLNFNSFASPVPFDKKPLTIKTPHFEILYYAEQQELAELYAQQFEKAWTYLDGLYLSKPEKVIVVLNDSLDQANGFATRIPYPFIMLYPVLPDLNDSISEFETWSLELATHELAHVFQFEPASGLIKSLRSVFGSIIAPNLLLPSWWKEGSSVWAETAISNNGGRLRSIYQEAVLRSWVGEKKISDYTIAQANENLPEWPYGSRPYFFGSLTMCFLIQQQGEKALKAMTEAHGGTVPYVLDRVTQSVAQKTYEEIYNESLIHWEEKATSQVKKLSTVPFDQPAQIITSDVLIRSPSFSGDGKYILWVGQDKRPEQRIKIAEVDEKQNLGSIQEIAKGEIKEARFFPQSYKIIFNEIKPASQVEAYSDLFVYDILNKKKTRLTKKLRGREAQVNPLETEVVFVGIEGGRTALRTLDLSTKNVKTLFTSELDERIASPLYLTESQILYSFLKNGKESLYLWDLSTNKSTLYNDLGTRLRRPLKVGSEIWVMSDLNRVFNLYTVHKNQLSNPKTHLKTTVLDFAVDPRFGSVYAVVMTSEGPQLFYFSVDSLKKSIQKLPAIDSLVQSVTTLPKAIDISFDSKPIDRPYKLWPHYWIPFISGSSASKGVLLSVTTSGNDPTFQHAYGLSTLYDTGIEEISYDVSYTNRVYKWPWALQSSRYARNFVGTSSVYYNQAHAITIIPDTIKISDDWGTSFSYIDAKYESDFDLYERNGPQVTFSFSNAKQTPWMISPEEGGNASVTYSYFNKSTFLQEYNQYLLKGAGYWSHWLPERHAIAFDLKALVTNRKVPSILGDSSTIYSTPLTSSFLIRGYLEGQFVGRNIYNSNLEYRFPLMSYTKGNGLLPFYIKRIHGAVVVDAIALDGYGYKQSQKTNVRLKTDQIFASAGLELKMDTTLGYIIPIELVRGLHAPFENQYAENPSSYFQIKSGLAF